MRAGKYYIRFWLEDWGWEWWRTWNVRCRKNVRHAMEPERSTFLTFHCGPATFILDATWPEGG